MDFQLVKEEYQTALSRGKKEYKERLAAGLNPHPEVLDEILGDRESDVVLDLGVVDIPADRIIGTKSAGRITAFTASFLPLLDPDSEFAIKWYNLCNDHLDSTGIREPILCYEYLGNFYVQEGNKRVSLLRYFDAPRIPGTVMRVVPPPSEDPRIKAYYEFMDFYKVSRLYTFQFRRPGDYAKLLAYLGKEPGEVWNEDERRTINAYFYYFRDAFDTLNDLQADILPEEALLLWLKVHPYRDLGKMSTSELKKSLAALWPDVLSSAQRSVVKTANEAVADSKPGIITRLISSIPDHVHVAFVHQLDSKASAWVLGHEDARQYLERIFGERIVAKSYFDANTPEEMDAALEQAVADGAQIVFTTAPKLSRATLKFAVKYPKIQFYNCSVDQPYSSVRTYYGRIYEAKFITGAIAGAMAQNDRIGYVASNPIFGVPASINAFALGALMTNPRAQIELRWSCCEGTPQADFFRDGIRVISNRDVPTLDKLYLEFCNYGTYLMDDRGGLVALASPVWLWGGFYENVIRNSLGGVKKEEKPSTAVNYWLGMDSGVIGLNISDRLPEGVRALAQLLEKSIINHTLDPFARKIIAQDGTVKNDGTATFTPDELLHMDWLCSNVTGSIPSFDQILPMSQSIVRELGIYRDSIPAVKERV